MKIRLKGDGHLSQREWVLSQIRVIDVLSMDERSTVAWQKLRDLMVATLPDPDGDAREVVLPLVRADLLARLEGKGILAVIHVCNDPTCGMVPVSLVEPDEVGVAQPN